MLTNDKDPASPFYRCHHCGISTTNEEAICRQCEMLTDIGTAVEHGKKEFYRQARAHRALETLEGDMAASDMAGMGEELHEAFALIRSLLNERKEKPTC
jgi:hypothetical protein